MSIILLTAITLITIHLAYTINVRRYPRRHGEIRPSSAWLLTGIGTVTFFTLLGLMVFTTSELALFTIAMMFASGGALMIGYYFHRRLMFRKRALYDVKAGRVANAVPYVCAWQCQLGEDIEREGIIIQGVGARRWAIPGATSREALSEALWCLKDAGVRLPDAGALEQRFGITQDMIELAAPAKRIDQSERISL
ncbi:MAG: hypothetical protein AAGH90_03500 [Pseudomonadota bacterium]